MGRQAPGNLFPPPHPLSPCGRREKRQLPHSQVLPGFWLRLEWLWQDPRLRLTELLAQMLQQ